MGARPCFLGVEDASPYRGIVNNPNSFIEIHPTRDAYRIVVPGRDEQPVVSNADFVEPILAELGIREHGPWESVVGDDGHEYRRALLVA